MVSKRNFFAIFLMMFVVLFLCQFSQVMRENLNQSNNDQYDRIDFPTSADVWDGVRSPGLIDDAGEETNGERAGRNVLFIGSSDSMVGETVDRWCRYTKTPMSVIEILPLYSSLKDRENIMILIDGEAVDPGCYMETIHSYVRHGATVVFCTLPKTEIIRSDEGIRALLGITQVVSDEVNVEGIRVFDGTFIGGEAVYKVIYDEDAKYQDLDLSMPWYVTAEGSKTYIIGMLDEDSYEREKFPRIVWRYSGGNIKVFAVNGDYMKSVVGLGILDMCLFESADYSLYPVVNAQTSIFLDTPDLAEENTDGMQSVYSRNMQAAQRDIFLPGIISAVETGNLVPTCMLTSKYDLNSSSESDLELIDFFIEQINGMSGEAGRSFRYSGGSLFDKLVYDNEVFEGYHGEYRFRTAYADSLDELAAIDAETIPGGISSVATDDDTRELFGYIAGDITFQNITQNAFDYSYSRDLIARSLNTSIGYSSLKVDLHNIYWPDGPEDYWEKYFDRIFRNISTFWSRYDIYEQTTLSESDLRIRRMLSLDYDSYSYDENGDRNITLKVTGGGNDCYFLLRTHEQNIALINGATYERLEDDAYLIHVLGERVDMTLRDSSEVLDYDSPFRDVNLLGTQE